MPPASGTHTAPARLSRGGQRRQGRLAGVLVLLEAPAQPGREQRTALVGAAGDELVALGQHDMAPGPVDVAAAPADGQHVEAGVDVELQRGERRPVGRRPAGDRHPHDDVVALAQRDLQDGVDLFALLDEPDHLLGRVAQVLGRLGEVEQAPQRRGVDVGGRRPQHPQLEPVLHLVEPVLEVAHLGGQAEVGQHERRVGQPDGRLGHVLHLDQDVDRPVEVGEAAVLRRRGRLPAGSGGQLPQAGDAGGRAPQEQHVAGHEDLLALDVGDPLPAPADGDDAHAGLHRQLEVEQRPAGEVRALAHPHPVRDLLGVGEVGDQLPGDAEAVGDDAGDVDRRVGDPLDRRDDLQHRGHGVGLAGVAGRHDAHGAHLVDERVHALLELAHLLGHVGVAEDRAA